MNIVVISGNVTREPKVGATSNGTTSMQFGVAVNERRKNAQTGQYEDVPQFFDCVWFGKRAEHASQYITKGMKVTVHGKLSYRTWNDKNTGEKRSKVEVMVDDVEWPPAGSHGSTGVSNTHAYAKANGYAPEPAVDAYIDDEDIPF